MAKKTTPASAAKKPAAAAPKAKSAVVASTPVRNTPVPKVAVAAAKKTLQVTHEMIAVRAFEIHCGGTGGSESDNWHRAERELRSGL